MVKADYSEDLVPLADEAATEVELISSATVEAVDLPKFPWSNSPHRRRFSLLNSTFNYIFIASLIKLKGHVFFRKNEDPPKLLLSLFVSAIVAWMLFLRFLLFLMSSVYILGGGGGLGLDI